MVTTIPSRRRWASRPTLARPSSRTLALLALLAATAFWGASFVAAKAVLDAVPPVTLAATRFAVALAVLLPLTYRAGARPAGGREAALLGLTGVALLFLCQNFGLAQTSATNATLIMNGGYPVLAGGLAAFILGERPSARLAIAALASLAGVVAVVVGAAGGDSSFGFSAFGDLLILAATASAAVYAVLGRRAFARAGGGLLAALSGATVYGLLLLVPAAAVELVLLGVPTPTLGDALLLLYLGVGCSAVTYLLWAYGLRHLGAGEGAVIGNLELPVGVGAAAILLGEPIALPQLAGAVLVLAGAWMAASPARSRVLVRRSAPRGEQSAPADAAVDAVAAVAHA